MSVATNIKRLREAANLTQSELASKLDVARSTVTQWENGWSSPRMGMVQKLAGVFGVSTADIVSDDAERQRIPANAILPRPSTAYAPLLGRVHAGDAQEPDVLDERVPVPEDVISRHPRAYFLQVEGQCMSKVYPEGCYILIDPDRDPQNGSIAVVSIDGADYVMRRLYRGATTLVLSPESWEDGFEDIVITQDDERTVEFHGTVVWFQSAEEME
ncbi:LexA family protein [Thermophilibacter sp.]